jgi:hypothetical protein
MIDASPHLTSPDAWRDEPPVVTLEFAAKEAVWAAWTLSDYLTDVEGPGRFSICPERSASRRGSRRARILVRFRSPSADRVEHCLGLAMMLPGFRGSLVRRGCVARPGESTWGRSLWWAGMWLLERLAVALVRRLLQGLILVALGWATFRVATGLWPAITEAIHLLDEAAGAVGRALAPVTRGGGGR